MAEQVISPGVFLNENVPVTTEAPIIPDVVQSDLNALKKFSTAGRVVFDAESIESLTDIRENRFIENIDTRLDSE